jgi:hypothetical protein
MTKIIYDIKESNPTMKFLFFLISISSFFRLQSQYKFKEQSIQKFVDDHNRLVEIIYKQKKAEMQAIIAKVDCIPTIIMKKISTLGLFASAMCDIFSGNGLQNILVGIGSACASLWFNKQVGKKINLNKNEFLISVNDDKHEIFYKQMCEHDVHLCLQTMLDVAFYIGKNMLVSWDVVLFDIFDQFELSL